MAKFNTAVKPQTVTNLAGGEAFAQSPEVELVSILLTSFVSDQYYRSAGDTLARLRELLKVVEPEFAAKAAVYARHEFGMRSITHVLAAEVAPYVSGKPFARSFFKRVIRRPDDMTEILSYYRGTLGHKKLPNAMKAGFAAAFDRFDGYQLGKYRGEGKAFKLIDVVNLVHPKGIEKNSDALKALVAGELRQTGTWEDKLVAVGQSADGDKGAKKAEVWRELLTEGKLGYLALVRNLRNILRDAPDLTPKVCEELTNAEKIAKSLILPTQMLTAFGELDYLTAEARTVGKALEQAIELSCANVPDLPNTLVVIDNSGSMTHSVSGGKLKMNEIGAAFGMILAKRSNADVMEFGDTARMIPYNLNASVLLFAKEFPLLNQVGHGTDFKAIFRAAQKKYDRIVIFSDMQGWVDYYSPKDVFLAYKKRVHADPFVYSVDLAGHGTTQLPERNVYALAGFMPEMFTMMSRVEQDKNALVNTIKAVTW